MKDARPVPPPPPADIGDSSLRFAHRLGPRRNSVQNDSWILWLRCCLCLLLLAPVAFADTLLWRIGQADNSNQEFTGHGVPATFEIPADWAARKTWPEWPTQSGSPGLFTSDITFNVAAIPPNAGELMFKTIWASAAVPELAVWCNGNPCGIIQIGGASFPGYGDDWKKSAGREWRKTYRLTIPREFFIVGKNTLRLQKLGHPYNRELGLHLGFGWDYFALLSVSVPLAEAQHGKPVWMGVQPGPLEIKDGQVAAGAAADKWLGVAFCGNPQRVSFWPELTESQPRRLEYLEALKALNMSVILGGLSCRNTKPDHLAADGALKPDDRAYLDGIFSRYGALFQYYELCDEPCAERTNASFAYVKAAAAYVAKSKPATVKLAPPGYAFGGGQGTPVNWDDGDHDLQRRELEALCQTMNGHSYGLSFAYKGGSLIENIDTHGGGMPMSEGWSKEMLATACGSRDEDADMPEIGGNLHASLFDRNLRGHIAFCDRFIAHALWEDAPFSFLTGDRFKPETWKARGVGSDADTRVKLFRRLALAYATHGRPLPYTYLNAAAVANQLVYFRAVDTSSLAPLPGSGATSRKILVSLVNFDLQQPHEMQVRARFPRAGDYTGERFGPDANYALARREVTVAADPSFDFLVPLGPGESVQFIHEPPPL